MIRHETRLLFCVLVGVCLIFATSFSIHAQQPDDVVRINTELVQTDVNVFDKRGRFVDNAKPEDFELTLDGKPQKILFFERVLTGTKSEASQISRFTKGSDTIARPASNEALDRVRTIFFFVDDTHLSAEGIVRARKALIDFI